MLVHTAFSKALWIEINSPPSSRQVEINLDKWKSIQVNGCVDCDFLVDFSFRVCNELPNGQEEHYTDLNIVICKDPYPFTINGKPPLNARCEWRALIAYPLYTNTWDNLYSCSYRLNGEERLIVRAVTQNVSQNAFAFSFRVRQWVNESIPIWKVDSTMSPRTGSRCMRSVIFSTSTVITVFGNDYCIFAALTMQAGTESILNHLPTYLTSYSYPWPFDNPTDYPQCQRARADFSSLITKTERRIAIDVIKLENGTLKLFYGTNPSNEKGFCMNPIIESKSIDLVDQQTVAVSAECFHLEFCPLQNGTKDRFGFVVKASRAPVDPKLVECKLTYTLSTENPQVLLHVRNIYFQEEPLHQLIPIRNQR
ncbi:unnamed protein product, partial [Mesorhabditis belari]|uniref:Uncharacterized protein n=1 Tax=Mesorhabditis belari TaxID=2138241 RepID=A0AAF3FH36_9BILA